MTPARCDAAGRRTGSLYGPEEHPPTPAGSSRSSHRARVATAHLSTTPSNRCCRGLTAPVIWVIVDTHHRAAHQPASPRRCRDINSRCGSSVVSAGSAVGVVGARWRGLDGCAAPAGCSISDCLCAFACGFASSIFQDERAMRNDGTN